ncbi:hypothetical protein QE152_g40474 [Popillia japonica]|uniref:Uncharacterized protein n=1 Tax=Popillia japonica TaxID=7064 RepID=A0AAW1HG65_POPJA
MASEITLKEIANFESKPWEVYEADENDTPYLKYLWEENHRYKYQGEIIYNISFVKMDSSSASSNTASTTNTTEASSSSASTSVPSSSSTPSLSRMVPANSRDDRLSLNSFEQLREILQTSSRATLNELGPLPSAMNTLNDLSRQKEFATLNELGPLPSAMNTLNDLSRQKEFVASMERYVQSSRGYLDRVRNKYKELWVKHRVCKIKLEMQEARIKRMVKETSDLQRLSDDQNCILCLEERR